MPEPQPLLVLDAVSKDYVSNGERVHALRDVSLNVGAGELVALVGRSGCGKSTLLNLSGAMDFPSGGRVLLNGIDTSTLGDSGLTKLRRESVGFVFQSFQLLPTLTVRENVELPLLLAGHRDATGPAMEKLAWVEMDSLAARFPHQLSGGQQQRVAIARALVHAPLLLLADEPIGNLDSITGNLVLDLLRRTASEQKVTILMATHSAESTSAADIVVRLRDGHVETVDTELIPLLRLFYQFFLRPMKREPVRTALTTFAVALGVAVVLAIDLAGNAAAGSFRASLETLTGKADLEITGIGGVPAETAAKLARLPYPLTIAARMEDYALVAATGETVPLIGLDLIATALDSEDKLEPLRSPRPVWVGPRLAHRKGETIRLTINDHSTDYTVAGILKDGDNAVVMDLALADEALSRGGRLDRILVTVPETTSIEEWQARIEHAVSPGVTVARQGARTDENRRMLAAFRWNLRVLSYIALVVGAFLIYNTISVSVVRRRPEIGILRALGATRSGVLAAFLGEAALFGVAGALLGLALGRLMAEGAVQMLATTVQALYVSSTPAPIELTWVSVLLAFAIGIGTALASAFAPAREASLVAPTEAMARGRVEYQARLHRGRDLVLASAFALAAAAAATRPPVAGKPIFGYLAALLLIAAAALAIPALVSGLTAVSSRLLQRALGVEAMLASRSLVASLRRTSVLVGALATAIAMMTSVGIMVGSFRQTVALWMDNQLRADLFVRPAGPAAADRHPQLAADVPDRIAAVDGVEAVDRFRAIAISYDGLPATLGAGESQVLARYSRMRFLEGERDSIFRTLPTGDYAVVSEPFANKHGVRKGDHVTLALGDSTHRFEVLGVYYDYSNERGFVVLDRSTLLKYLPDPAPSNLAVFLKPGLDLETVRGRVEAAVAGRSVLIVSNRTIRTEAIKIFDRTFAITYALEAVAVLVAVMGIAGALLALVIDRRREMGLLRFLGASAGQVRKLILCEAGLLGLLANVAGLALGSALSLILIYVINKQSFGWTIQFHWPVVVLGGALTVIYASTVLAGLYPARVAHAAESN